jgi:C1A family cysteine protease
LEGAYAAKTGTLLKFAEQQLVDCSHDGENSGCNGGMSYDGYTYYETNGPVPEADYPYTAKNGECTYNSEQAYDIHTTGHVTVPFDDIPQMYAALSLKPLNVSIYASAATFRSYSKGIYNDPNCGNQHNHATNVVGLGIEDGIEYWVMRNSWGTSWGEGGYIRM